MREMKDSGIESLGPVPTAWDIKKIKYTATIIRGGSPRPIEQFISDTDEGFNWIKIGDTVKGSRYITQTLSKIIEAGLSKTRLVHEGTLLLTNSMSFGEPYILKISGCIHDGWVAFYDYIGIDKSFLYYALLSDSSRVQFEKMSDGGVVLNLNIDKIGNCYIALPPGIQNQTKIVDFLDAKCAEIDALTADIQSQIDTLEKYKRSVITETVTKGLDKNVEMKESGLQWVGKMPAHWDIERIGSVYTLRTEKVSDEDYPPLSVTMQGIVPQLETAAKTNDHGNRKLIKEGDFVINSRSDRRGSCGISEYDGSVSLINTVLKPNEEMNPDYYNWLFHTPIFADEFYKWGHGIVDDLWTTGWEDMKKIYIPQPPLVEQALIAEYLDKKCKLVDEIISKKHEQLTTLDAYKKSTIYEYVTGKKEVPA